MRATLKDIPQLAQAMYDQKAKSSFAGLQVEWSVELCALHLEQALHGSDNYIAIARRESHLLAACGATLVHTILPPYTKTVMEWMWFGVDKRNTAKVWKECKDWGRSQGATRAVCSTHQVQLNPTKQTEVLHWRTL